MRTQPLGGSGPPVSRIGLGCMGMSDVYGPADEAESIATIHAALDAGINLIDTGDFYGMGHNEMLLGRAIRERARRDFLLSVKFGALRTPSGQWGGFDGRPQAVKNFAAYSLKRLGTDYIDIYRPARVDAHVPIEETVGAVADLIRTGHVRFLGLSEAGAETVRRAHRVQPVVDLQIEYSLMSRGIEGRILPTLRELGIGVTAYGVLSRGLLGGGLPQSVGGMRASMPRFQGENYQRNLRLTHALARLAEEKGLTPAQLAIAWVLSRGADVVPLIGTTRRARLREALDTLALSLSAAELAQIEQAVPHEEVAGTRYGAEQMTHLDSER
jgi:aryl-alcohol dehydrogenase-like predicted oxidoreductase